MPLKALRTLPTCNYIYTKESGPSTRSAIPTVALVAISGVIIAGGIVIQYFLLKRYTDSDVPAWDAWVSATAWAGTWLLAQRKIENWVLLNVSNLFAVPLLFHKKLPLFAGLTIILFIVACVGYFDWIKRYKTQTQ